LTTPGRPALCDEHYPPKPAGALDREPRARTIEERAFLELGEGAERVERALRTCADAGRFADGDLASILAHQQATGELILFPAPEERSLQRSTRS